MHVESFDSMDEAFAAMAVAEDSANMRLTPGQVRLRDAVDEVVYWASPLPDYDMVVYGRTPPIAEVQEGAGFDVADNRSRGYLTGMAYSADMPNGEDGDTHVSQVVPIPEHIFLNAQTLGWPTFSMLREPENAMLGVALAKAERESLS